VAGALVSLSGRDDRDRQPAADDHGNAARRDRLATAGEHRLSALDRQYEADWQEMSRYDGKRKRLHNAGRPTYRLCR
jgi:hypothetical protein